MSSRGIEEIKASMSTIDSEVNIWFCKDSWRRLTSKAEKIKYPVIIWDYVSFHIWKESAEFMLIQGMKLIIIIPCSPQLNTAEKIIRLGKN